MTSQAMCQSVGLATGNNFFVYDPVDHVCQNGLAGGAGGGTSYTRLANAESLYLESGVKYSKFFEYFGPFS